MHSHRVAHRDLKPGNILVSFESGSPVLKIADLGMGRVVSGGGSKYTRDCTTLAYRSPEVLLGARDYDPKALDVWSVGCIVAELVDAYSLFRTVSASPTEFEALMMIFRLCGTPDETSWPGVAELPYFNIHYPRWARRPTEAELESMGYRVQPIGQSAASAFMFSEEHVLQFFPRNHGLFRSMLCLDPARRPPAWQMLLRC